MDILKILPGISSRFIVIQQLELYLETGTGNEKSIAFKFFIRIKFQTKENPAFAGSSRESAVTA
jgi:hypothetical protein